MRLGTTQSASSTTGGSGNGMRSDIREDLGDSFRRINFDRTEKNRTTSKRQTWQGMQEQPFRRQGRGQQNYGKG
jgi:hypothetical protein